MGYAVGQFDVRPWGTWEVLAVGQGHIVKRIFVRVGGRLSLQRHQFRGEHWIIVQGQAVVTIGDVERIVEAGHNATVPQGAIHRIANPGCTDLVVIEVQHGARLEETDIERFEDDYGRLSDSSNVPDGVIVR